MRVAACIMLLYARPLTRISRPTIDDILDRDDEALLRLGDPPTPVTAPVIARSLGFHDKSTSRIAAEAGGRTAYLQLHAPATTADAWHHTVRGDGDDAGLTFACRFLPLPLKQPLADDQDAWLGLIDPRWTTATDNPQ